MASSQRYAPNSLQNENDDKRNVVCVEHSSRRELLLRKELHKSFDLNQVMIAPPIPHDSDKTVNFPLGYKSGDLNKVGKTSPIKKDTKLRRPANMEIQGIADSKIDLELRLALPANAYCLSSPTLKQNQSVNLTSRLSGDRKTKREVLDYTAPRAAKVPSLVLMGCSKCYLYVMVPETDPKCPKCEAHVLIDVFRWKHQCCAI